MTRNPIVGMVRAALWSSLFWGVCFLAPTWLHAPRDSALYPLCVYLFAALGVALVVAALTLPLAAKQVRRSQMPRQRSVLPSGYQCGAWAEHHVSQEALCDCPEPEAPWSTP